MTSTANNFLSTSRVPATWLSTPVTHVPGFSLSGFSGYLHVERGPEPGQLAQVHRTQERQEWWAGPAAVGCQETVFDERCRCCFFNQVLATLTRPPLTFPPPPPRQPMATREPSGPESPLQPPSASSCCLAALPVPVPAAGAFIQVELSWGLL